MKPYLLSLGAGLLVGLAYSLLGVRSPAPPVIALVGLFGILLGEQVGSLGQRMVGNGSKAAAPLAGSTAHGSDAGPIRASRDAGA